MSFSRVRSRTLAGIAAPEVAVETHLANGLPSFTIVGLPETAIKESRDRVRSAIINSNYEFPSRRITVNLAPADLPKEGARFDLPIAVSILLASGQLTINPEAVLDFEFVGELALNGQLRSVGGILPVAYAVSRTGRKLVLPTPCMHEAALIRDLTLVGGCSLNQMLNELVTQQFHCSNEIRREIKGPMRHPDFADVKGQYLARQAMEIAAAGHHNLLMVGPPGCGKSMLAARLPGILPLMPESTAIESASMYSISRQGFILERWRQTPFRAPHHSCSPTALIGGGSKPVPGEISLAHGGVLFLDEIPEFDRRALEMLREPLETGCVNISRVNHRQCYLANVMLIGAANPCHCGYHGSSLKACRCTRAMVSRYQSKLSGPLIDRFDLQLEMSAVRPDQLTDFSPGESSATIAARVAAARQLQLRRQNKLNGVLKTNQLAQMLADNAGLKAYVNSLANRFSLTARSYYRVLRLARTIADLNAVEKVAKSHVSQALQYRQLNND